MRSREAFVTVVLGAAYQHFYARMIQPSQERLARRTGRRLIVVRAVPPSSAVDHPHPSWEKLRIFDFPELAGVERACWLDADLYAMGDAPDPFEYQRHGWLAVNNNALDDPEQATLDRYWHWPCPTEHAPTKVINTGLFVVNRDEHADYLRDIYDAYTGRWDQGPFSLHLQALPGQRGPEVLNRIAVHTLASHGFGPRGLRALVAQPALVHFASAAGLRGPALRYVIAADHKDRLRMRLLEARSLSSRLWWPVSRRWFALRRAAREGRSGAASWWHHHAERQLARAIAQTPRLYLNAHQSTAPGWVTVDPVALLPLAEEEKHTLFAPPSSFVLPLASALPDGSLAGLVVENVLERVPAPAELLDAGARRLKPGDLLQVAVNAGPGADSTAFARAADHNYRMSAARLRELARDAGLKEATVGEGGLLQLGALTVRLPRHYALLQWQRPSCAG